jgi:WD40 repeat protein
MLRQKIRNKLAAVAVFALTFPFSAPALGQSEPAITTARAINAGGLTYEAFFTASGEIMVLDGHPPSLWDTGGNRVGQLDVDGYLLYGSFLGRAPSRRISVIAGGSGSVSIVDLATGEITVLRPEPDFDEPPDDYPGVVENPNGIVGLAFDPTSRFIGAMTRSNGILVFSLGSGAGDGGELRPGGSSGGGVFAFAPDGRTFASTWDQGGSIWDGVPGNQRSFVLPFSSTVDMAFDPSGERLAITHSAGVSLIDAATGATIVSTAEPTNGRIVRFDEAGLLVSDVEGNFATLHSILDSTVVGWVTAGAPISFVDFDLERELAVVLTQRYSVLLVRLTRSAPVELPQGTGDGFRPAFSPDGRHLIWGPAASAPGLWDLSSHELVRWLAGEGGDAVSVRVSADSQTAAAAAGNGVIRFWELSSGDLVRVVRPTEPDFGGADVSPDFTMVALNGGRNNVGLFAVNDGSLVTSLPRAGDGAVLFAPDGSWLVTGSRRRLADVLLWSLEGVRLAGLPIRTTQVTSLRVGPRGEWILANGLVGMGGGELWHRGDSESVYVTRGGDFDPTGSRFVGGGTVLLLSSMESTEEYTPLTSALSDTYSEAVYSPDGAFLAAVTSDAHCEIWDTNERRLVSTLHANAEGDWAVRHAGGEVNRGQIERPPSVEHQTVIVDLETIDSAPPSNDTTSPGSPITPIILGTGLFLLLLWFAKKVTCRQVEGREAGSVRD